MDMTPQQGKPAAPSLKVLVMKLRLASGSAMIIEHRMLFRDAADALDRIAAAMMETMANGDTALKQRNDFLRVCTMLVQQAGGTAKIEPETIRSFDPSLQLFVDASDHDAKGI